MLYYISGGQRSGKSRYAQDLALQLSPSPVYLATSRAWDDDHRQRIARHVADRDERWTTLEEEKYLSRLNLIGRTVVLDCVTLWLTNFFTDTNYDVAESLRQATAEFDELVKQDCTLLVISNEIGMGLHASNEAGRKFTDLQGWLNQHIAQRADHAIFMVSGLPLTIK
ncbi:bifunctional adenosylcobinamide kinase/adenosylcobinamide-phosphate guanylyltransferase [Hymenobacter sp. GOD-10R]|uniref:bifunctional adenosylcobinamide kinase/adenosylcobinamide-phosphate guanylyltransferase n=1 Tax=Hymenobacter sp. GOD-10R TaxID=3093922 RepID=UPI002D78128B|nr:bifunctional adenosylcobinamide kinase/adenosylcobinamide-phosphate guanylyltransferase [Hymenobacter sp. GOD-10R]WRQ28507.1 bifunctional adenosylcobinamide kinase/adenosylcobinamide-phosphate guanylyltransferase [Hymenobacter sp. GOD-10R]